MDHLSLQSDLLKKINDELKFDLISEFNGGKGYFHEPLNLQPVFCLHSHGDDNHKRVEQICIFLKYQLLTYIERNSFIICGHRREFPQIFQNTS